MGGLSKAELYWMWNTRGATEFGRMTRNHTGNERHSPSGGSTQDIKVIKNRKAGRIM